MNKLYLILSLFVNIIIYSQKLDTTTFTNSKIYIPMVNNGNIGGVLNNVRYDSLPVMYSSGFFLSGKLGDSLWSNGVFGSENIYDYAPGKFLGDHVNVADKFYILNSSVTDFDSTWENWKDAVQLGAYFYDGDNDGTYNPVDLNENERWDTNEDRPDLIGDYTNWTIFSDKVATEDRWFSNNYPGQPQGIEIRQSTFAYTAAENDILDNTFFIRYIIENVSENELFDSVYFGFVSDPDIGNYGTDLIGSDSTLNCVFGYKRIEDDEWYYGSNPPSIVTMLLQGPRIHANQADTSFLRRGEIIGEKIFLGEKNLEMTSSWAFGRYRLLAENVQLGLRNVMLGGKYPNGNDIDVDYNGNGNADSLVMSADSINLKYIFSGDPVSGEGWLNIFENDWRMLGSTGPFQLEKNKPQEIIIALVIARGDSPLKSVSLVKEYARGVKRFYESNFTDFPVDVKQEVETKIINKFVLSQNYPNPFNPATTIEYSIPNVASSFSLRNVSLKIFDILGREVAILVNKEQKPGTYKVVWDATNYPSGVYFYRLKASDFNVCRRMLLLK